MHTLGRYIRVRRQLEMATSIRDGINLFSSVPIGISLRFSNMLNGIQFERNVYANVKIGSGGALGGGYTVPESRRNFSILPLCRFPMATSIGLTHQTKRTI